MDKGREELKMELFLNTDEKTPKYIQLYEQLKEKIICHELTAGEKLPSIRYLAQQLGLSKHTIDAAYQQLLAEGYIQSVPRSGLYVLPIEGFPISEEMINTPSIIPQTNHPTIDFHYGSIDLEKFPLNNWAKCMKLAMEEELDILQYGAPKGDPFLREEIRKYVAQSRGITCTAKQILICNGTQQSVSLIIQLLNVMQQPVFFEDPGYNEVRNMFQKWQCDIIPVSIENDGIDMTTITNNTAKVVYVTPSHQFPLGGILPIQKRYDLLKWAEHQDSYIIEDDYNSEFRYIGKPIPSLKSLDQFERVIYLGTFSKNLLPAIRCCYIILPDSLVEAAEAMLQQQTQNCSPLLQRAIAIFMRKGYFEKHVRRMKITYQKKQQILVQAIKEQLGDKVEIVGQQGGLHILLKLKNTNADTLIERAMKVGVKVYSPKKHWLNPDEVSYIILGFGGVNSKDIVEGITKLKSCF